MNLTVVPDASETLVPDASETLESSVTAAQTS